MSTLRLQFIDTINSRVSKLAPRSHVHPLSRHNYSLLKPTNARNSRSSITCCATENLSPTLSQSLTVEAVLERVVGIPILAPHQSIVISGTGTHLGMDVEWTVQWQPSSGGFMEDIRGQHISCTWGYDFETHTTWEVDSTGCSRKLALDDHESAVLSALIRSGAWTSVATSQYMDIEMIPFSDDPDSVLTVDKEINYSSSSSSDEDSRIRTKEPLQPLIQLQLKLKQGRVPVRLYLTEFAGGLVPVYMAHDMMCDVEKCTFNDWRHYTVTGNGGGGTITTLLQCPTEMLHDPGTGELSRYTAHTVRIVDSFPTAFYKMPESPLVPADTSFLPDVSSAVPAYFSPSGHVLVKPTINGKQVGLFILDTGASCFVIEPDAANALDMDSFGELYVTGMSGKVKSRFRKAANFQLGPLIIKDPTMVEMPCKGLVRGTSEPVVGIIGHEVFRRSIVDMPAPIQPTSTAAAMDDEEVMSPGAAMAAAMYNSNKRTNNSDVLEYTIHIHHPDSYTTTTDILATPESWLPIDMICGLPHIHAELHTEPTSTRSLLMLDTGAGGVDIMLNSRGVSALGLDQDGDSDNDTSGPRRLTVIKGVGGDNSGSIKTEKKELSKVVLGSSEFHKASVLCALNPGIGGGLELSYYGQGIICGELLKRCRLIVDFARHRVGLI